MNEASKRWSRRALCCTVIGFLLGVLAAAALAVGLFHAAWWLFAGILIINVPGAYCVWRMWRTD